MFLFSERIMVKKVTIDRLDVEGHMSDNVGRALRCNGEENGEEILKKRGWTKEKGPALTLLTSTREGKITGMKLKTFGDQITVAWEMGHLWPELGKVRKWES